MPKKSKEKSKPKTKEEVLFEENRRREIARKREIIVDKFYPALTEATISVDEAKALIQAMGTLLMESVLHTMKERSFDDIIQQLHDKLCADGERSEEIKKLLETLRGENLFVAREIIEGMTRAIEAMIIEDMRSRSLYTLKTNWEGYLN